MENIQQIVSNYLDVFSSEKEKLAPLMNFLKYSSREEITDWNNSNGHLTVGAFVYCKKEDKFLVLYHKDLEMYLYPDGHVEKEDVSLLASAKRELKEETGLENLELLNICNARIPIDIDIHKIPLNKRVNMSEHYHFDFRYLFYVKSIDEINFDKEEFRNYKWITTNELSKDTNYGKIVSKLNQFN